jgi:hypothetical protein
MVSYTFIRLNLLELSSTSNTISNILSGYQEIILVYNTG